VLYFFSEKFVVTCTDLILLVLHIVQLLRAQAEASWTTRKKYRFGGRSLRSKVRQNEPAKIIPTNSIEL